MRSSFFGFYVAKSGLQSAQANLQITGHNMTNANTDGYTRQRVDTRTVGSYTNNMRYASSDIGVGGGVENTSVGQIRNPYLDVRYRMEHPKVGDTEVQLDALNNLENLFDEISKDGIDAQFKDLISQLQTFVSNSTDGVVGSIVKTSSLLLTQSFNNAATQIDKIWNQEADSLDTNTITDANALLKSIAHLNQEIKSADISGNPALELIDQRNMMLDELSQYANIETSVNPVSVGAGVTVYEMSVDLVADNGEKFKLVENDEYRQLGLQRDAATGALTTPVTITLSESNGTLVTKSNTGTALTGGVLNDYLTTGTLGGALRVLNGQGVFATGTESTERGIGYYSRMLDNLAQTFADIMNSANSVDNDPTTKPLFTTDDGETTTGINAHNLSLSDAWEQSDDAYLTTDRETGQSGDNLLYMITKLSEKRTYHTDTTDTSSPSFFNGTFQEFVTNISTTLGLHIQDIDRQNTTYNSTLSDIDTQRTSISSVDINEEGINLIMYNQALSASSRFMTTLDEALDTIINKMGITGR